MMRKNNDFTGTQPGLDNGLNKNEFSAENQDLEALKSLFKTALETRNFEISMLVQRNNFFMIFQGVLFAGMIQSAHEKAVVSFMVCIVGLFVSFYQMQMASGAKFWQEYWEAALHDLEKNLIKYLMKSSVNRSLLIQLFHKDENRYKQMVASNLDSGRYFITNKLILKKYSVSRVPIYVAIALTITWLLLVICTLREYPPLSIPSFITGFV